METFVRVVEAGSFSAAARDLNVGQPAVSRTVLQMEARLGVRLLMRSTRGLSPTEAGQSFYERAKRAIEEADQAERAARGAGASLVGRLRVSAAVTFASLHIVPHLPKFLARHPDLSVDMVLDDRLIDLVEEGVDVALRIGSLGQSSMTARKLASGARHVVASPAYFASHGIPATPAELAGHDAVIYSQSNGNDTWSFRKGESEVSVSVAGRLRATATEGVRAAVLAGLGLTIASAWMFSPELASGAVRTVLNDWSLPPTDLWAVYPSGRMPSAKARALVAFLAAEMRQDHAAEE